MPSEIMDQSRFYMTPAPHSFFSEEIPLPGERAVGFWKPDSVPDHHGGKFVSSSSFGRPYSMGAHSERLELSLATSFETRMNMGNCKTKFNYEHQSLGKHTACHPMASWRAPEQFASWQSDLVMKDKPFFVEENKVCMNGTQGFPSSSLFAGFDKKLRLSKNVTSFQRTVDNNVEDEPFESLEDIEAHTIGNLLPNDDELLSGLTDDHARSNQLNNEDDTEDDIFYSGGGIELEADEKSSSDKSSAFLSEVPFKGGLNNSCIGEHPSGEHPSRTLFVRNINKDVEDAELRSLFEQYGDIQTFYTACRNRGFVMISYYDIRSAQNAMRELQDKPLRHRKLDIHFSIPMIHEAPHNHHHNFIEYNGANPAEAVFPDLNGNDIASRKLKIESSLAGGATSFNPELEDESARCWPGIRPNASPLKCYGCILDEGTASNGHESTAIQRLHSVSQAPVCSFTDATANEVSSNVCSNLSSPIRVTSLCSQNNHSFHMERNNSLGRLNLGFQCMPPFHPHSLPDIHDDILNSSVNTVSPIGFNMNSGPSEEIDHRHIHRVSSGFPNGHSFEDCVLGGMENGNCSLNGHPYLMNNSNSYHHNHPHGSMMWSSSPFVNSIPMHASSQMHGLSRSQSHMLSNMAHLHHVGSAPVNPSPWDKRHVFTVDSSEASAFHPGSLGHAGYSTFPCSAGNGIDSHLSSHLGIPSPQQRGSLFHGRTPIIPMPPCFDVNGERIRSRRNDANMNQSENKKQYELVIDRIVCGEDSRTTLMIKNIPNKYTSKMLLATIDEFHFGTYDFIYLPIDFKNKCNVGYAFINMIDPQQIIPFYKAFNGRKWEKFNSEKIASLAYARIQGKAALIAHFQNSSLMNEDKRCRPILFHTDGPNAGDQEPFPVGPNVRSRSSRSKINSHEDNHRCSPPSSANTESSSNGTHSSNG